MNISNPLHKKEPVNTPQAGMPTGSDKLRCSSLYTDGIVERNPARAALQLSPAGGRAFAGLDFHDGVQAHGNKLRPCVVRSRSFADIKVGDADLHKESYIDDPAVFLRNHVG